MLKAAREIKKLFPVKEHKEIMFNIINGDWFAVNNKITIQKNSASIVPVAGSLKEFIDKGDTHLYQNQPFKMFYPRNRVFSNKLNPIDLRLFTPFIDTRSPKQELRYILLNATPTFTNVVATDTRVLIKYDIFNEVSIVNKTKILIPLFIAKLGYIEEIYSDEKAVKYHVKAYKGGDIYTITWDISNITMSYPNYERIIPHTPEHITTIDIKGFATLKATPLKTDHGSNILRFSASGSKDITITDKYESFNITPITPLDGTLKGNIYLLPKHIKRLKGNFDIKKTEYVLMLKDQNFTILSAFED